MGSQLIYFGQISSSWVKMDLTRFKVCKLGPVGSISVEKIKFGQISSIRPKWVRLEQSGSKGSKWVKLSQIESIGSKSLILG